MKKLPVTRFFDQSVDSLLGELKLTDEAVELIKKAPHMYEFAVGFIGTPNDDGTYDNVELVEVSLITRTEPWKYQSNTKQ